MDASFKNKPQNMDWYLMCQTPILFVKKCEGQYQDDPGKWRQQSTVSGEHLRLGMEGCVLEVLTEHLSLSAVCIWIVVHVDTKLLYPWYRVHACGGTRRMLIHILW